MTVGCFLKISPSNAATLLRDRGGKAQVSVVGTADYAYTLSRETPLKILPDPSKV